MTRFLTFLFCAIASASAAPIFQISQLLGPSPDSANYGSWVTDRLTTLGTGATSTLGVVDPAFLLYSTDWAGQPFPVWQGQPAASPGPYENEYGTWLYFAVRIVNSDSTFQLAGLLYSDTFGANYDFGALGSSYGGAIRGLTYNPTAILPDGTPGTTPVNELLFIGPGTFFDMSCAVTLDCGSYPDEASRLAAYGSAARLSYGGTTFQATYSLPDFSASSTMTFAAPSASIPEPATALLVIPAALYLVIRAKRRK